MSDNGFVPPQNIEAEKAVIGGVLLDPEAMLELPRELKPESFYVPSHGHIFQAMLNLWDRKAPIDVISVAAESAQTVLVSALTEIQEYGMPQSIAYHADLVIAAFRQRKSICLLREALREIQENPNCHDEILSQLYSANDQAAESAAVPIRTVMLESLERINGADKARTLIPTGFTEVDRAIFGIEKGELVIIAGRPSMGKTSLALDLLSNAAVRGFPSFFVSVETSREKIGMRMLSKATKINSRRFRTGQGLDDDDRTRLVETAMTIAHLPIHVLHRESGWPNIKREIRSRKRDGLDLVILDYLTLLEIPVAKNDRRDLAVGRIANEAKQIALSLDVAFVLLSQLNRKSEGRDDPEPIMSDLRDSGDIEQAADIIIFPFRPIVYDPEYRPSDKAFLKIAKARDLPIGKIPVRYQSEITSFSDWEPSTES
jgi:replicative DNA helicase